MQEQDQTFWDEENQEQSINEINKNKVSQAIRSSPNQLDWRNKELSYHVESKITKEFLLSEKLKMSAVKACSKL